MNDEGYDRGYDDGLYRGIDRGVTQNKSKIFKALNNECNHMKSIGNTGKVEGLKMAMRILRNVS